MDSSGGRAGVTVGGRGTPQVRMDPLPKALDETKSGKKWRLREIASGTCNSGLPPRTPAFIYLYAEISGSDLSGAVQPDVHPAIILVFTSRFLYALYGIFSREAKFRSIIDGSPYPDIRCPAPGAGRAPRQILPTYVLRATPHSDRIDAWVDRSSLNSCAQHIPYRLINPTGIFSQGHSSHVGVPCH